MGNISTIEFISSLFSSFQTSILTSYDQGAIGKNLASFSAAIPI